MLLSSSHQKYQPYPLLCKLIWRHWTYKMPVKYISSSVSKIKHILSYIQCTICGTVSFQFTRFPCDKWENIYIHIYIYILFYCHHQIGSMNYYPLFRVRSWNNGMRCMFIFVSYIRPHVVINICVSRHVHLCMACKAVSPAIKLVINQLPMSWSIQMNEILFFYGVSSWRFHAVEAPWTMNGRVTYCLRNGGQ